MIATSSDAGKATIERALTAGSHMAGIRCAAAKSTRRFRYMVVSTSATKNHAIVAYAMAFLYACAVTPFRGNFGSTVLRRVRR